MKLENIKLILDIGASLSAIVAISFTLCVWIKSKQKPLKVKKVQIFKKEEGANSAYCLFITNGKDYPVTINKITGYRVRSYTVYLEDKSPPELTGPGYRSSNILFETTEEIVVHAEGEKWIRIEGLPVESAKLFYTLMETSNGRHTQKCSKIEIIESNDAPSVGWYDFTSPIKSKIVHRLLLSQFQWVQKIGRKCGDRWKQE